MAGYYPRIDESTVETLCLVRNMFENDERFLDGEDCPYSEGVKKFLREISQGEGGSEGGAGDVVNLFEDVEGVEEIDLLDIQIQKMLSQMEMLGNMLTDLEPNERLNFFKTRAGLMERLISLREKTTNLRDLLNFKEVVVHGLEDICSEEQVKEFIERIGNVR